MPRGPPRAGDSRLTVHRPILATCLRNPLRRLIIDDQRKWRGIDLLVGAFHLAGHIQRTGRAPTVGIMLPSGGAFPAAALGAWILGRTVVPLNYLLKQEELQYVIDDCGTDLLITARPMLEFLGYTPRCASLMLLDKLNFRAVPEPRWPGAADPDSIAALLYTSGTSGRPKGVMLSHANIRTNIEQAVDYVQFDRRDVLLGVLPQFHSFGFTVLTLLPLSIGAQVVFSARFVPGKIVRLFREHRPTAFVAIPSMYHALMSVKEAGPEDFSSLRFAVSGGEPLPRAVAEKFRERFGVTIAEGYGLTETSPVTNWCLPQEYRPGSVGRALPRIEERIVDMAAGGDLGPDQDGEVRIKGPNIMKGYFQLAEQTAAMFDERGFLRTGDIGRFDRDGHLYITGRLKEMIIVGGENVFPREIEEVLDRHESVQASAVIGVRDEMRGETPWAFVELKDGAAFDESALRSWCRERLAGYKVPREIRPMEKLPRNPTGKIMRRELKKLIDQKA